MKMWPYIKKIVKRFTLFELLNGLGLTGRYFFRKKITLQFPEEFTPASNRFRGVLALRRYDNKDERCIACRLCEAACPACAITIEAGPRRSDGTRRAIQYDVDVFKCINCGFCEEACPVDAIVATPLKHYQVAERGDNIFTKEKLLAIGDMMQDELTHDLELDKNYR